MKKLWLVLLLGIFCGELCGQDARARLESQRKQLQQEIVQINGMLQKNKNQKADALESLEDIVPKDGPINKNLDFDIVIPNTSTGSITETKKKR